MNTYMIDTVRDEKLLEKIDYLLIHFHSGL